ncbi:hypothetical protein GIB67_013721 [Kingdonia uniflora]|uniref:Uncharacterized protein n=1 Tax=Kingdonia uniflora TaxID=39325 RepID=A0A7J7NQ25_9MAGN|nr:hypothetical protein GIB67_013721 [Kingdonia uniflora]
MIYFFTPHLYPFLSRFHFSSSLTQMFHHDLPALNWREKNPIMTITLLQLSSLYLGFSTHLFVEFWWQFSLFFPYIYATSPFLNLYLTCVMFYLIF